MNKKLNPKQFIDASEKVYDKALQATIAFLKEKGEKCYVVSEDWEEQAFGAASSPYGGGAVSLSIFGVGLNESGKLCVAAVIDDEMHNEDAFPRDWTDVEKIYTWYYPDIYRFVADNIDKSVTKKEADIIVKNQFRDDEDDDEGDCYDDDDDKGTYKVRVDENGAFVFEDDEDDVDDESEGKCTNCEQEIPEEDIKSLATGPVRN